MIEMENGKRTTTYENESEKERIDGNEDEELKRRVKTIMLQQIMIMMIIKSKFEVSLKSNKQFTRKDPSLENLWLQTGHFGRVSTFWFSSTNWITEGLGARFPFSGGELTTWSVRSELVDVS